MWKRRLELTKLKEKETLLFSKKGNMKTRAALLYPDSYYSGISYLGFQQVYRYLNEEGIADTDRYFWENEDDMITMDGFMNLSDFPILLLSLPYVSYMDGAVKLLKKASITLNKNARRMNPVIVAGGPGLWLNPYPLGNVIDLFVFGDIENKLEPFFDDPIGFIKKIDSGELKIPGLLTRLPEKREHLLKEITYTSIDSPPPHSAILTKETFFANMFLVELGKGCVNNCSFCTVPRIYHQRIFRKVSDIIKAIDYGSKYTKRIGLISSMVLEHPGIQEILEHCKKRDLEVSTSSLSVMGINEALAKLLNETGNKSITLALESLCEKARIKAGKPFTDEEFLAKLEMVLNSGIKKIKIYLILGLPGDNEDADRQDRLWSDMLKLAKSRGGRFHFSVNPLIPMPFTPMEKLKMMNKNEIKKTYKAFKTRFSGADIRFESVNDAIRGHRLAFSREDLLEN